MTLREAIAVTFDLGFPLLMIVVPAVTVAFVRFRPDGSAEEDEVRSRREGQLAAWLWGATAASAALVVGLWAMEVRGGRFAWTLFFPLWFGLAWPLAIARNPAWGNQPRPPVRAARLTPRVDPPPAPRAVFAAAVVLWLAGTAVAGLVLARQGHPEAWLTLLLPLGGGAWLGASSLTYRGWLREAEPLPPHPAPELELAYGAFRLWLRRCFFWFGLAGAAVFTGAGVMGAFAIAGQAPIWAAAAAGGIAGTLFGIAGGVVGTFGTKKRFELNRLYREAVATGTPATDA